MLPMIYDIQCTPRYEPLFTSHVLNVGKVPEKVAAEMIHRPQSLTRAASTTSFSVI